MKKALPLGISSFEKIIEKNLLYIDKTPFALKLVQEEKYSFLARPRRFGKSLLVSTLKALLSGQKELFKNCSIYQSPYDWKKHPVIHLDFSAFPNRTLSILETGLKELLNEIAISYGVSLRGSSVELNLKSLVMELYKQDKVVILIDEYDKPILDNLHRLDVADQNREFLKGFFHAIKSLNTYLRFVFITGITKFTHVSFYPGLNNLKDITMDPRYAEVTGYTENEITEHFDAHIQEIAQARSDQQEKVTKQQILDEMKLWYKGYRFSSREVTLYNPHSTLHFMDQGLTKSYWYNTGAPSFLFKHLQKQPHSLLSLTGIKTHENALPGLSNLAHLPVTTLLFQTGYLTIRDYDPKSQLYYLDFPNHEVRTAFYESSLTEFIGIAPEEIATDSQEIQKYILLNDLDSFFKKINTCFAKIPHFLFKESKEGFYHALLITLLEGFGVKTKAEESTNIGRIDLSFETSNTVYLLECKLDQTAEAALEQIERKKYQEKYSFKRKNLLVIGVNFCSTSRNLASWKAKLFSPVGELTQEIYPASS